jgi:hypothetical protein
MNCRMNGPVPDGSRSGTAAKKSVIAGRPDARPSVS